ncbi:Rieske 2Fe-2S domain-containing protein [Streptomyces niveiscabiei]|uniref:aromatic ring-hydroxylating oxygenase subunit alpha n=1 Tax=Streptomyces niveiscabiei TaxID=164115 RepID=UPI0029A34617|nr:Rieske 2Fe-2S domain-containing protein [Streptomyces niveiscabiei]MDX3384252.1 Rieske 2Fe-2S domain-containing protein [Streptomyces niveiscabiei]
MGLLLGRRHLKLFRHGAGATPASFARRAGATPASSGHGVGATPATPAAPGAEAPLPHPTGWFCLALSHEIRPGTLLTRRLADTDVVLARGASGVLRALHPHCPHLGAHLGVLGEVSGDEITCGFHRFTFSLDGPCLRTAYGRPAPRAPLGTLHVRESGGLVLVWHGQEPPSWEPPAIPTAGWQRPRAATYEVASHPQQMTENVIDFGHLEQLHGATLARKPDAVFDGPSCTGGFQVVSTLPRIGRVETEYTFAVHGLGLTVIECALPVGAARTRFFALPTPIGPWRTRFRFAATATTGSDGPLGTLGARLLREVFYAVHAAGSLPDLPVWQYQAYQPRPRLAAGDGPIGKYRKWAEQFYPAEQSRPAEQPRPEEP